MATATKVRTRTTCQRHHHEEPCPVCDWQPKSKRRRRRITTKNAASFRRFWSAPIVGGETSLLWQLEELVDANGLATVLSTLADICFEKSDHLATEWQDRNGARMWRNRSAYVRRMGELIARKEAK